MSHVYISHSSQDLDALLEIHEALRTAAIPDWYAPNESQDRPKADQAIDDAFAMIVLVSASGVRSKSVRQDVERAKARNLRLIPYQIDKARLNGFFKHEVLPHLKLSSTLPDGTERLVDEVQKAYKRKCPVLAVMNLKGGVGKTTVTQYNLTQTFFDMDYADASAAADRSVISLFERSRLHSRDVVSPGESWLTLSTEPFSAAPRQQLVHDLMGEGGPGGRLDLISGQFEISKYAFANDSEALLKVKSQFLRMVDNYRSEYDLIVFDTNPNATFLTRCALEVADRVLTPMHADVYSLRGVRLLNQVISEQVEESKRPALSVLFNAVGRSEQSTFEADARNGEFDAKAGFPLSKALLKSALPRSGHLVVKTPKDGQPPWRQLVIHSGRGGGLKSIRGSLKTIGMELQTLLEK